MIKHGDGSRVQGNAIHGNNITRRATITKARFEGDVKELSGAYFYCAENCRADTYDVSMNLITGYVIREYTHGVDIRHVKINMENTTLSVPVNPIDNSYIENIHERRRFLFISNNRRKSRRILKVCTH